MVVIDPEGFRANVAIVLMNQQGKLFWGQSYRQDAYQFPQGGVNQGESVLAAMYRELHEEIGLLPYQVELIATTPNWIRYNLPKHLMRTSVPQCIGQKQKWFLLRILVDETAINCYATDKPEFGGWYWADYSLPATQVISFKRRAYRRALRYFYPKVQRLLRNNKAAES